MTDATVTTPAPIPLALVATPVPFLSLPLTLTIASPFLVITLSVLSYAKKPCTDQYFPSRAAPPDTANTQVDSSMSFQELYAALHSYEDQMAPPERERAKRLLRNASAQFVRPPSQI